MKYSMGPQTLMRPPPDIRAPGKAVIPAPRPATKRPPGHTFTRSVSKAPRFNYSSFLGANMRTTNPVPGNG